MTALEEIARAGTVAAITYREGKPTGKIVCADGFTLSVQAGYGLSCSPRPGGFSDTDPGDTFDGPYTHAEVGFPSAQPEPWDEWSKLAEDAENPTQTVYGWVPFELVTALVELHGGEAVAGTEVAKDESLKPVIVTELYAPEVLGDDEDNGTMPANVADLAEKVIGRRIVSAEKGTVPHQWRGTTDGLILTLDNGKRVTLANTDDCCAYTDVEKFLLNVDKIDHAITGVGTTEGFTKWHIYADFGDVLELDVKWSCGNAFYYGYGFDIAVQDAAVEA